MQWSCIDKFRGVWKCDIDETLSPVLIILHKETKTKGRTG